MENRNVIVLKTDIQSEQLLRLVSPLFDAHKAILKWSVDLEDCDKVLRVEVDDKLDKSAIVESMIQLGIKAEDLKH